MAKKTKEEWKTYQNVFDQFTLRNLFKLSTQNHFEELYSPVALGKEANVFSAYTKTNDYVIVKIYRLQTCDFNQMYSYIRTDPRFAGLKKQRRKVIFAWTQREFQNLMKARSAGVRVPTPITFMHNIIVMELIGTGNIVSKQLKDDFPETREELQRFFNKVFDYIKKLYHKARLVHGDLSEFNILNHKSEPVFIDFSQASPVNDPNADEYLKRDIRNICRFFNRKGLTLNESDIYKEVITSEQET